MRPRDPVRRIYEEYQADQAKREQAQEIGYGQFVAFWWGAAIFGVLGLVAGLTFR